MNLYVASFRFGQTDVFHRFDVMARNDIEASFRAERFFMGLTCFKVEYKNECLLEEVKKVGE